MSFTKKWKLSVFLSFLQNDNSYNVKDLKYPGQRTRGDSGCPIGVSSSGFISIPLFYSVSGLKTKSFVIAEMHFIQRALSYSRKDEGRMEARQNKRGNMEKSRIKQK